MNVMTSPLSSKRTRIVTVILLLGVLLHSCQKDSLTIPLNVGTIRFAANSYTIENNTVDPLTLVLPLSLPLEEDATAVVTLDNQTTALPEEYTISPAIPATGLTVKIPKGATEVSFKVSSLNNFEGERKIVLKLTSATGGLTVANVNAAATITVKGNPIILPEISTSEPDLAFGNVVTGTTSASKSYTLTSVKLTSDVTITATANFEVSLDDVTYRSSLTIPFATANTAPITIYTRFLANTGVNQGVSGTITHTSGTVPNAVVHVTGVEYGVATIGVLIKKDDFSYGSTATSLTTASSKAWAFFSAENANAVQYIPSGLSYTGYAGSGIGGAMTMENKTASAEDVSWAFPDQSSGTVYIAQLMNFSAAPTSADFFSSLGSGAQGTTPLYYNRVYVKANGTQFTIGVSRNASTSPVYYATSLDYGTTYLVVTKYEFATGNSSMYVLSGSIPTVEPAVASATSSGGAADPTSLTRAVIRQSTNLSLKVTCDGVRIATSWKQAVGL